VELAVQVLKEQQVLLVLTAGLAGQVLRVELVEPEVSVVLELPAQPDLLAVLEALAQLEVLAARVAPVVQVAPELKELRAPRVPSRAQILNSYTTMPAPQEALMSTTRIPI
jgi:hypothetical protein